MKISDIYNEDNKNVFYHVTPTKNVPNILTKGLKVGIGARSEKLESDNRIFLFKTLNDTEQAIMNWLGDEFNDDEDLTVLEITLPRKFTVYHFSNVGYEYYVTKDIPANYIKATQVKV